ncbi:hypothetical protein EJ03DRAFT_37487 [Teratosphaeria nubilosa]|uniref:Uncharacterized protein n=1 Tax=Teratosphaeria nubilosa TaxID=161662 RepID=A0A6G1LE85_9PEZI|nr:hypothetical protein EJ03DRAFT_37487 [Teratosphaeria nubilosa]
MQAIDKTDLLGEWISPGHSTSTKDGEITSKILGLGLTGAHFKTPLTKVLQTSDNPHSADAIEFWD